MCCSERVLVEQQLILFPNNIMSHCYYKRKKNKETEWHRHVEAYSDMQRLFSLFRNHFDHFFLYFYGNMTKDIHCKSFIQALF